MSSLVDNYYQLHQNIDFGLKNFEGIGPLLLRLYLVPVFWMAGSHKIDFTTMMPYEHIVDWFGNPEWGLGLPLPTLMAFLAGWAEVLGAVFLLFGFAVRWISVPLIVTMIVAAVSVHWEFGWQAIADASAPFANERVEGAVERLARAKSILQEHGNYDWLTANGSLVVLNNGIEFAVTYLIMLVSLLFTGGGRFTSVDYWLRRRFMPS